MKTRFFDFNATTPLCGAARDVWNRAADESWLNPSSPYRGAAAVRVRLEAARQELAERFGVAKARMVFNSGATEGNNSVFAHWARTLPENAKVAISPTEHPSVVEAAKHYFAGRVVWLKLDVSGAIDVVALRAVLDGDDSIGAVSVMAANNETGILNDWQRVAEACRFKEIVYHCDASQWIGKLPLEGFGLCDFLTGCAHKFGGPKGVGFLILPKVGTDFSSLHGGVQEGGHRAGTEDVLGVLAMVAALRKVPDGVALGRDRFVETVSGSISGVEVVGLGSERLWNTVMLLMPEFEGVRWIRGLERRGFLISTGSACSTGKNGPSHVLAAMGVDAGKMRCALRISGSIETLSEDWMALADALEVVYFELQRESEQSPSEVISL